MGAVQLNGFFSLQTGVELTDFPKSYIAIQKKRLN